MKKFTVLGFSLCVALTTLAQGEPLSALTDGWYAGVDVGQTDHEFTPRYTVPGEPGSSFVNESDGAQYGAYAGYDWLLHERLTLGLEGRVDLNDAEWSLTISEPASFKYQMPYSYSLGIVSRVQLPYGMTLFAEVGAVQAEVEQKKSGSPNSNYDVSESVDGLRYGGGLMMSLADLNMPDYHVVLAYRVMDLDSFSYVSRDSVGSQVEEISDSPEAESWSLGITRRF